jgi:hypothetical protein
VGITPKMRGRKKEMSKGKLVVDVCDRTKSKRIDFSDKIELVSL